MRILHMISGGDKGGAKTSVFALLLALNEKVDITIACFTEGVFYQEVQELPVESVLFKQKFRNDLSIIHRLSKYIRQNGFDIVHAHGARANFISMMLKPFVKVPVVTTVHSDYKLDFTDKLYKKIFYTVLNSVALRTLDYYIGVSEEFRKMLIARGFNDDRVFSVYNAVDFNKENFFCSKEEFLLRFNVSGLRPEPHPLFEKSGAKTLTRFAIDSEEKIFTENLAQQDSRERGQGDNVP
ncbi:MAG: glycosyltransferase family 4 protein, partial [Defluviitaleaceae bacterium]|nr:glycosyltransferase family 4 protein [Defluviitaleaceae bacterium]